MKVAFLLRACAAGALLLPALSSAQGRFWLVDVGDQFVAEVASVEDSRVWAAIPAPGGEPVFTPFEALGGESLSAEILYESTTCTGTGYVIWSGNTPAMRTGYVVGGNEVWGRKRTSMVQISAQSNYTGNGNCQSNAPTMFNVGEVEFITTLSFVAPLRVIWNPDVLLLDGFELGNSSHW